ncbi:MAG: hypothetical protein KatS3mg105_4749 [Gemmatales bacterium]|nr:MAG: hypothetical protein KatS3mg105_4749 [Gemmatales bacterium]
MKKLAIAGLFAFALVTCGADHAEASGFRIGFYLSCDDPIYCPCCPCFPPPVNPLWFGYPPAHHVPLSAVNQYRVPLTPPAEHTHYVPPPVQPTVYHPFNGYQGNYSYGY